MEAEAYIREKGWHYKRTSGDNLNIQACPLCGDTGWHFYIHRDKGAWDCKKCGESGNLWQLKRHLGDLPVRPVGDYFTSKKESPRANVDIEALHKALLADQGAMQYLRETRGFSDRVISHFRLGLEVEPSGKKWLAIPITRKGKLVNIKYRSLPPSEKAFRRLPGCPSALFNGDALGEFDEVIITESETDAIALWDRGFQNVVSSTLGAGSIDTSWIADLKLLKRIFIAYNQDEQGQKGARELAARLGRERCLNMVLPVKDVNEFFLNPSLGGRETFKILLQEAKPFQLDNVITLHQALSLLKEGTEKGQADMGLPYPWPKVERIAGRMAPGDLIVVSATPKTGKTTFCLNIADNLADQGIPVLFYCLEMRPERIVRKLVSKWTGKSIERVAEADISFVLERWASNPLYLGYNYKTIGLDLVLETIRDAYKLYGIKLAVFDHLHFLCRDIRNTSQQISLAVQGFKLLAEELEIPIILVAQPRKLGSDSIMTLEDLRDSSLIGADADTVIFLYREKATSGKGEELEAAFKPETLVRVEASRYKPGGETLLYFDGAKNRFGEIDGKK